MAADEDPQSGASGRFDGSLGPWPDVTIPDDLSGLAADIETYRAEQRAAAKRVARARRRARAHPSYRWLIPAEHPIADGFTGPRPRRLLLPLIVTAVALFLCTIVTVLLTMLAPRFDHAIRLQQPLASGAVLAAPGQRGGLVPAVDLHGADGRSVPARDLRPAVLLLVPANCNCTDLIERVATNAQAQTLGTDVIVSSPTAPQRPTVAQQVETVDTYTDPTGALADGLGAGAGSAKSGTPLAVVVDGNGVIVAKLSGKSMPSDLSMVAQQYFAGR